MGVHGFNTGTNITIEGAAYKILHKLPNGRFQLRQAETSEIVTYDSSGLLTLYANGKLEFVPAGLPTPSGATWHSNYGDKPFSEYSKDDQAIASRRERYVKAATTAGLKHFTRWTLAPIIEKCARNQQFPDNNPPSWISVYRWHRRYIASGCDIRSLVDQRASQGRHKSPIDPRVRELAIKALDDVYLTLERPSMVEAQFALIDLISIENKGRAPSQQLKHCSTKYMGTVLNEEWDQFEITERRYGNLAAKRDFRAALGRQERPKRLMQRVELDHVFLDVFVVDDDTFLVLGRPVIAFAVETLSRCIAGFAAGFNHPSAATVAACLKHAILPKGDLTATYPNIKNQWDCMGSIETLVMDRALENLGRRVASAGRQLGMDIEYNQRRTPWGKGIEERLNRTVSEDLIHIIPGTTFSNVLARGDYQSAKHAIVPKTAFLALLHKWIVDVYQQTFHHGIHDSPAHKWELANAGCPVYLPRSARDLDIALGMPERQTLWHYGIGINHLKYNSDELTELRRRIGNEQLVDFMWYEEKLSHIDVFDPEFRRYIRVACVDRDYAAGLTLYQHQMNLDYAKQEYAGRVDMAALAAAKAELRQMIKDCFAKKRGTTRKRLARYLEGGELTPGKAPDLDVKPQEPTASGPAGDGPSSSPSVRGKASKKHKKHEAEPVKSTGDEPQYLDYAVEV